MDESVHRSSVDLDVLEEAASRLLPVADDVAQVAARVRSHTPDPGAPPAPDAVLAVQQSASDALSALARALQESSALLVMAARRYQATEVEVSRVLDRLDRLDGGPE